MRAHGSAKFHKATMKEVESHSNNEHWEIMHRSEALQDQPALPDIWTF